MSILTREEIDAFTPEPPSNTPDERMERARQAMQETDSWLPGQRMGSQWPIACVALEITQRCNLDCTCCYLSEHSEAVHDIPLAELLRRIDLIHRHYGEKTNVQITGGDPTLRARDELLSIVRRVRERGMRATLMTNGIRATRKLLAALCESGLTDVAFHVDTTQQIKGYANEMALNAVRKRYLERARGLPLSVMFNTTVHAGNFEQIPDLVRFFREHAAQIRTVSFQPQARIGRGVAGERPPQITLQAMETQIRRGAGTRIRFDAVRVGHPSCTRYGICLAVNGELHDLLDEPLFVNRIDAAVAGIDFDRTRPLRGALRLLRWLGRHPGELMPTIGWAARKLRRIGADLFRGWGHASTLSFVVHNFMDADALGADAHSSMHLQGDDRHRARVHVSAQRSPGRLHSRTRSFGRQTDGALLEAAHGRDFPPTRAGDTGRPAYLSSKTPEGSRPATSRPGRKAHCQGKENVLTLV